MKKKSAKRIAAVICIALLVLLSLATLVTAFLDFPGSDRLFQGCLVASVSLPILFWIYIWLYGKVRERRDSVKPPDPDN